MEEYTQITLDQWTQWKEDIRRKLQETAGNFVYIGYRLKQIRDSGMYDGEADIFEFAQKEYGLSKSTVSRFIAINEKFSEGGNSLELKAEYRAIGSSKLAEMLTLPDAECALITEKTTVKEIRELKNFDRQQDSEEEMIEVEYNPLQKCIIDFFSEEKRKEALNQTMQLLADDPGEPNQRKASELINPGEYATHKKGIVFLFLYDFNTGVKYKKMGQIEPVSLTWTEFLAEIIKIYQSYVGTGESVWNSFYHIEKEEPKAEETQQNQGVADSVATSQQEEDAVPMGTASLKQIVEEIPAPTEEEIKKAEEEMKAAVVKKEEKSDDGAELETIPDNAKQQTEEASCHIDTGEEDCKDNGNPTEKESIRSTTDTEQLPGQTDIENDFPEMLPGGSSLTEEEKEAAKQKQEDDRKKQIAGYKAGITSALKRIEMMVQEENWAALASNAEDIKWRAEQILKLGGQYHG